MLCLSDLHHNLFVQFFPDTNIPLLEIIHGMLQNGISSGGQNLFTHHVVIQSQGHFFCLWISEENSSHKENGKKRSELLTDVSPLPFHTWLLFENMLHDLWGLT